MPNTNAPSGLRPVRHRNGAPYNGAATRYFVPASDATALFLGDPVILAGSADVNGVATVTRATAGGGSFLLGPVVSVDTDDGTSTGITLGRDSATYRVASTARYVWVADDPDIIFAVQSNGSTAVADVGLNMDLVAGAGSTVTGWSGFQAADSTKATTNTLQLRVLGFNQNIDNEVGNPNAKLLVAINLHALRNLTGI
jgi:hypothetical protein